MAFFGFRAYPTPILKPLWPFFASSAIVYYCVSKMQSVSYTHLTLPTKA